MTNFPVWLLYHCPCVSNASLRTFVQNKVIRSGVLIQMMQEHLHEDFPLPMQFSFDEFPFENAILISCKKDLVSHFISDPYSCFYYYLRRHFSFVND